MCMDSVRNRRWSPFLFTAAEAAFARHARAWVGRGLVALSLAALATVAAAGGTEGTEGAEIEPADGAMSTVGEVPERLYFVDLLRPETTPQARERLLPLLIAEADAGDYYIAMLLGHLYFLGPSHPAGVLERRLDHAERYFRIALDAGFPGAMLPLAEVALANGDFAKALVWVQAHMIFREHIGTPDDGPGYAVTLLSRVQARGRRELDQQALVERVQSIMDSHGPRMLAFDQAAWDVSQSQFRLAPRSTLPECRTLDRRDGPARSVRTAKLHTRSHWAGGYAEFVMGVSPQGRVTELLVYASYPNLSVAEGMATALQAQLALTEVPDACPTRWTLLPAQSANVRARLR